MVNTSLLDSGEGKRAMTGTSKILTVSYGTFSCTLEGFDDPFSTMKSIAEYFRDLASDDRYFGAEPPTPDVEMLQNLAEKEVNRRVEARIADTGISLRQMDEEENSAKTEAFVETPAEIAPQEQPAVQNAVQPAPEVEDQPDSSDVESDEFDGAEDTFSPDAELDEADNMFFDAIDTTEEPLAVEAELPEPAPADVKARAESVAEKLSRIRAVVASSDAADAYLNDDYDEAPLTPRVSAEEMFAPVSDEDEAAEQAIFAEQFGNDPADLPAETVENTLDAVPTDTQKVSAPVDADIPEPEFEEDSVAEDNVARLLADDAEASEAEISDEDEEDIVAEADDEFDAEADDPVEPEVSNEIAEVEAATDVPEDEKPTAEAVGFYDGPEARIVRLERADLIEDEGDNDEDEDTPHRERLKPIADDNSDDVRRILQETDHRFQDGEGQRRRRIISQMRAAVAATKADRFFRDKRSSEETDAEEQSVYREDLSHVVRPRRPEDGANEGSSERPVLQEPRLAPLMLVSEQRVDNDGALVDGLQIRPRRILDEDEDGASQGESAQTEAPAGSFADFATKVGAKELADLLEAAAAYSAYIEGEPHFSRPAIMKRVAKFDPTLDISREVGLRTFGKLLRQGRIQKLQRGQFAIGAETQFSPTQRIAGE